jgi:CheY-like chemotaxis protein
MNREAIMASILIVDDQPYLQELFAQELVDEGYSVLSAADTESAKRSLEQGNPDLVLLDLYLNGFEGWNLLDEIKHREPHLPVLIVTAYDSYMHDPRVSQADGYVIKSFSHLEGLKQKIAHVLDQ